VRRKAESEATQDSWKRLHFGFLFQVSKDRLGGEKGMIDEKKLREKLVWLLGRARYAHISTTAKETLVGEVIDAVKECEIAEAETVEEANPNTLRTAVTETEKAKTRGRKRDE
jgi:hypothetical protein